MKTVSIILSSLTILMVLSQLICGLWLQSHGADSSNITFHVRFGVGTVITALTTIIVMLIFVLKH
jgi:hypothetical protein